MGIRTFLSYDVYEYTCCCDHGGENPSMYAQMAFEIRLRVFAIVQPEIRFHQGRCKPEAMCQTRQVSKGMISSASRFFKTLSSIAQNMLLSMATARLERSLFLRTHRSSMRPIFLPSPAAHSTRMWASTCPTGTNA